MKKHKFNSHVLIRGICLLVCIMGILVIGFCYSKAQGELTDISLSSEDDIIKIGWDSLDWTIYDYVTIQIKDDTKIVYEKDILPIIKEISYTNGEHGKAYTVSVSAHYRDGFYGENVEKKILFLDYDQLPDIPLLIINTHSGDDPTYDVAEEPEPKPGATIDNNEYISGEMVMVGEGVRSISTGVDIKVRGNTSSVYNEKKSYKIKLDDSYDLLGGENGYVCNEWALLNNGNSLKTYIGDYIGTLCGMEWQPQMMFVNVILNGDWKGCYCLTESVGIESAHGLVSEEGCIFENDVYWWNEDYYFKTDNQVYKMGYTFKYPKINSENEMIVFALQSYMQEFEDRILSGDVSYQDYIDENSWARWFLARDILGNVDGSGANMYFYIYDFDENDSKSRKMKMGPLWDFDADFRAVDDWSSNREGIVSYFPQLFDQDSFSRQYTETWKEISPYLYDNVKMLLDDLEESYGEDIEQSWQLEVDRWGVEIDSFYKQKEQALDWFSKRIIWMNNALQISDTQ